MPGRPISQYRVLEKLGSGGMEWSTRLRICNLAGPSPLNSYLTHSPATINPMDQEDAQLVGSVPWTREVNRRPPESPTGVSAQVMSIIPK
jgi:hypothetical protein